LRKKFQNFFSLRKELFFEKMWNEKEFTHFGNDMLGGQNPLK
jgi:hypothetical protein